MLGVAGCGGASPSVQAPTVAAPGGSAASYPDSELAWGKLHSARFRVSVPLPDVREWKVDESVRSELVATHAATQSKLRLVVENEPDLMNRQRCEARARELGFVPPEPLRTVEDSVTVGPEAYDTRVWVAIAPAKTEAGPIVGHVFAFGAYVRRCLFVDVSSVVPTGREEGVLSQRLALARVRTIGGLTFDKLEDVPREKEVPGRR